MGTSVGSAKLATKARLSDLHKRQLFIDPRIEADSPPSAAKALSPKALKSLERAKGFEPSTPTLARLCSTPELRPLWRSGSVNPDG